jgi:hypothetical protein
VTSVEIPRSLRDMVRSRAGGRCEYCQIPEALSGISCEIDHVIPRARGGITTEDNLCLACSSCNAHKASQTHAADPESGAATALFHPRQQRWQEHFAWSEDGTDIVGTTPCGRATVTALKLNHPLIVAARAIWVSIGLHPPRLASGGERTA